MRSLFWKIFLSFWLAIFLAGLGSAWLGHLLNRDAWLLQHYPGFKNFAQQWVHRYENHQDHDIALRFLINEEIKHHIYVQVFDEKNEKMTLQHFRVKAKISRHFAQKKHISLNNRKRFRRFSQSYISPQSGQTYLLVYYIPNGVLINWQRNNLFWPISALLIALAICTALSTLITLSITRPIAKLRNAVHALSETTYQQNSLIQLSNRHDELGALAQDFDRMGLRLQNTIEHQQQLLWDVSHELRSPLARLKIAVALVQRSPTEKQLNFWPRITREVDRLDLLISEILAFSRLDTQAEPSKLVNINSLIQKIIKDFQFTNPEQSISFDLGETKVIKGWANLLERAVSNLLQNALRFNPKESSITITANQKERELIISIRDYGPGAPEALLSSLDTPFVRAPGQKDIGYGLGLSITQRAIKQHNGALLLNNHPEGGFVASLHIPIEI